MRALAFIALLCALSASAQEYPCTQLVVDSSAWSPCGQPIQPGTIWGEAMGAVDPIRMDFPYSSGTQARWKIVVLTYRKPDCLTPVIVSATKKACNP